MTDPVTTIASDAEAPNLAVDIVPDVLAGSFTLDVSDLDGPDMLAWADGSDAWINIICEVQSVRIQRGATRLEGVLTRADPGTMALVLSDTDRRFDPTVNGEVIHPGTPIRVRAWGEGLPFDDQVDGGTATVASSVTGFDGGAASSTATDSLDGGLVATGAWSEVLFTGRIGSGSGGISVAYQKNGPPIITIQGIDRVGPLANWKATGYAKPGVGAGDNLLQRVERVADELQWVAADVISEDVDDVYEATHPAHVLDTAWPMLNAVADAELGRLWVDRTDRVVVRGRDSELSGPIRGTLSDVHDEIVDGPVHCCYDDAEVVYGTELLANRAIAGRRIDTTGSDTSSTQTIVQVDDDYSQARYGLAAIEERDLELETDDQLLPWAQAVVLGATEPELRVNSVSVAPRNAPDAWPHVAATDIGDRWSFRYRPGIGPPVAATLGVLGIEHDITPQRWTCEWLTVTAVTPGQDNPSGWFTLDSSLLDEGDLLAPIGGTVAVR